MLWRGGRRSANIEDRRGFPVKTAGGGGLLLVALLVFLAGGDPTGFLIEGASRSMTTSSYPSRLTPEEEQDQADFVSVVLAETEDVWQEIFSKSGRIYAPPTLVLFSGAVDSACGLGEAVMGPFYCPVDRKVYLDLEFFYELEHQHDAPGDFARAYVIAHEIGHHVQTSSGKMQQVSNLQRSVSKTEANRLSVLVELQADCYAGIWASYMKQKGNVLEAGDIEEALRAASQIGDDRLQQEARGYVVPDSFTHGTSAQRYQWFQRGFSSGRLEDCETF